MADSIASCTLSLWVHRQPPRQSGLRFVSATRTELVVDGWEQLVVVREDGGLVTALVMHDGPEMVRGIVVMYEEDEELVLVNVIGKIQPETFGKIMQGLEIEIPSMAIEESEPRMADL